MTDAKPDGRHERARATRERIVTACRAAMLGGNFRPSMREVAAAGGCSVRAVFHHFSDVEGLHRAALDVGTAGDIDAATIEAVARAIHEEERNAFGIFMWDALDAPERGWYTDLAVVAIRAHKKAHLTRAGAERALMPGDVLDPEDWP